MTVSWSVCRSRRPFRATGRSRPGFFAQAKNHLAPGGVFSFGIDGVANYISETRRQKLSSLANTAHAFFDHVILMPGRRLLFVCSDRPVQADIPMLLEQKGIETRHIRRYFAGDLTDQRISQINAAVDAGIGQNLDLSPRLMRFAFVDWFARHGESPRGFTLVLAVAAVAYLLRISRPQWVLLTTGCINIGAEMVAIFTFPGGLRVYLPSTRSAGYRFPGRTAARCLGRRAVYRQPASGIDER